VTGWGCRHEVNGVCQRVDGALCRPGMRGCILVGKVTFADGRIPAPVWPVGHPRAAPGSPGPDPDTDPGPEGGRD